MRPGQRILTSIAFAQDLLASTGAHLERYWMLQLISCYVDGPTLDSVIHIEDTRRLRLYSLLIPRP